MGVLISLDVFYRTQLELEPQKDSLLNSATNYALAPLQNLFGQNKYKSLEGKVSLVPTEAASTETLFLVFAIKKVVLCVFAIFLTPVGTVTRAASLYVSSDVKEAYEFVRLLKLEEPELDALESKLSPDLFQRVKAARRVLSSLPTPTTHSSITNNTLTGPIGTPTLDPQPPAEPRRKILPVDEPSATASDSPLEPMLEQSESSAETKKDIRLLLISFFRNLDQKIQEDPNDDAKIEAWLKTEISRLDYSYYFFFALPILYDLYVENTPDHEEIHLAYRRCKKSLISLGLQRYTEETPSPEFLARMKKEIEEQKEKHQETCRACLFVLRPLYEMLQQLPPQSKEEQCQAIEAWFTQFKARYLVYNNPFHYAPSLIFIIKFLTDILSDNDRRDLVLLHDYCIKKLRKLELSNYLNERPAILSPAQLKLRDQLIDEVQFFRALCDQAPLGVFVAWLQENSPTNDYPLLWGQQRALHLERYSDGIDPIILKAWKHSFSECQTRLAAYHLQSYLHIDEIPADASPELRSFLVSDLCTEIQAAIKNRSDAAVVLTQHLRFYLNSKKYGPTVLRLIPSELLSQWKDAFSDLPEEALFLPDPKVIKAATQFYRDLSDISTKEGIEAAKHWLEEQKADKNNYAFYFYHSLYWQTLSTSQPDLTLNVHCASHKKIVQWAYENNQGAQLFETPPAHSPGLCQLVHRLTEDLVLFEIQPEAPVPVKASAPPPLHPFLVHNVDDEAFKTIISELAPHMAPVLQKPEMFLYWKNTLLDSAVFFCLDTMAVYAEARTKKSKKEVLTYLSTLKSRPGFENQVTLFSKDYETIVERLAPLLPKDLAKRWINKYGRFYQFLRKTDIQDDSYIDVQASPFFAQSTLIFKEQFKNAFKFFEDLEKFKDNESKFRELITEYSHLRYFWFAREFDHLCKGYDVKEKDLGRGKVKRFKELFDQLKPRLQELKLEHFLTESAPARNIMLVEQVIKLLPPENS